MICLRGVLAQPHTFRIFSGGAGRLYHNDGGVWAVIACIAHQPHDVFINVDDEWTPAPRAQCLEVCGDQCNGVRPVSSHDLPYVGPCLGHFGRGVTLDFPMVALPA